MKNKSTHCLVHFLSLSLSLSLLIFLYGGWLPWIKSISQQFPYNSYPSPLGTSEFLTISYNSHTWTFVINRCALSTITLPSLLLTHPPCPLLWPFFILCCTIFFLSLLTSARSSSCHHCCALLNFRIHSIQFPIQNGWLIENPNPIWLVVGAKFKLKGMMLDPQFNQTQLVNTPICFC